MVRSDALYITKECVKRIEMDRAIKVLSEKMPFMEEVFRALYIGAMTQKNVLLYGEGGYGKSAAVELFCKYFAVTNSTIVGYEDMPPEKLLGVPNMKLLMDESTYRTAFNKTAFSKKGILTLEEFLDVRPETAACLKDILTRGGLVEGDVFYESLKTCAVICTNTDPEVYADNPSLNALYLSRFPIRVEVKWEEHTKEAYTQLFKAIYKDVYTEHEVNFKVLSIILSDSSKAGSTISPRVARDAADIMLSGKIEDITVLTDINCDTLNNLVHTINKEEDLKNDRDNIKKIRDYVVEMGIDLTNSSESEIIAMTARAEILHEKLNEYTCMDENFHLVESIEELLADIDQRILSKMTNYIGDEKDAIDDLFKEN